MQIQLRNNSATGSHYRHRTLQSQPPLSSPISLSSSSSSYQLLQHPMIVQSRSTDSQLDVESSNLYSSMKYQTTPNGTNTAMNPKSSDTTAVVPSFFNRTHPSLYNESSESSSSSSTSISIVPSKESTDVRSYDVITESNRTKASVTNFRRRRSQDIFTSAVQSRDSMSTCDQGNDNGKDEDDSDDDDDDDDDDERNFSKRGKWDADTLDTHGNGLWIQRSYAFDEDDDDEYEERESEAGEALPSVDQYRNWTTEPLIR